MNKFGICLLDIIPIRETITHSAQMVSQVLFGEIFYIEEKYQTWLKIRTIDDDYTGWIDEKQISYLTAAEFEKIKNRQKYHYVAEPFVRMVNQNNMQQIYIGMGASLPLLDNQKINLAELAFSYPGEFFEVESKKIYPERISAIAYTYLNTPYLWGGRSFSGIDCSGYVQQVYKMSGILLPRDSKDQAEKGKLINFVEEAKCGDLMFFDNAEEQIVHVGIYLGENKIIHASAKVRIDSLDHQGIFSNEENAYTHNLRLIKRVYH